MNYTRDLEIRIFKKAALISSILIILSLTLKRLPLSLGVAAGFFLGIFHFKMIVSSVKKLTNLSDTSPTRILSFFGCLFRFLVLGVVFWLAATKGLLFFIGTVAGFFTIKASIIMGSSNKRFLWKT